MEPLGGNGGILYGASDGANDSPSDVGGVSGGASGGGEQQEDARLCSQCGASGALLCSSCMVVAYCSPKCQRAAWPAHKSDCRAAASARVTAARNDNVDTDSMVDEFQKALEAAGVQSMDLKGLGLREGRECAASGCTIVCAGTAPLPAGRTFTDDLVTMCHTCNIAYYCSAKCKGAHAAEHAPICAIVCKEFFKVARAEVDAGRGGVKLLLELSNMYYYGSGAAVDKRTSFDLAFRAAKLGDTTAMYNVARRLHLGEGVAVNTLEAKRWYRLAGEHGTAEAWHNLGLLHTLEHRHEDAVACFRLAATATPPVHLSCLALGDALVDGTGVARSESEAAFFYERAASSDLNKADKNVALWRLVNLSSRGVRAAYDAVTRLEPQDARSVRRRARRRARFKRIEFVDGVGLVTHSFQPGEPGFERAQLPSDSEDESDMSVTRRLVRSIGAARVPLLCTIAAVAGALLAWRALARRQ